MSRWKGSGMFAFVGATRSVPGDPWPAIERFAAEPPSFLPPPAHRLGDGRFRTTVHGGLLHREVLIHVGALWTLPDAWIRPIRWTPARDGNGEGHGLLPDLSGRLALRQDPEGLRLEVAGHYSPPFGVAGAILDSWRLREVAERTLDQFAGDVSSVLTGVPAG